MQQTPAAPGEDPVAVDRAEPAYPHPFQGAAHVEARHVPVLLHRMRDAMSARMRAIFDPHGLTDTQWRVLRLLSIVEELDAAELAQRAFLLGPSLSRIIRDLVDRGLIRRRASAQDARRWLHSITPEGMELVRCIIPEFDPLYERIEVELGMEDLQQLTRLMDKLATILDRPL